MTALVNDSTTCAPAFVQRAGVAALRGPQDGALAMRDAFRARRDALVDALATVPGVRAAPPDGAFYVFADVRGLLARTGIASCSALAAQLLRAHDVACIPGRAYGPAGAGMLRLSFTTDEARLREAVGRIGRL